MRPRVRVTLTYVSDEEAASSIVKEVESGGGSAAAVPMDLTDHSSIERAVSAMESIARSLEKLANPLVTVTVESVPEPEPPIIPEAG